MPLIGNARKPFRFFVTPKTLSCHIRIGVIDCINLYCGSRCAKYLDIFHYGKNLNGTEQWIGYSISFVGVSVALVQGGLIRFTQKIWGSKKSVFIGLCLYVVGFTLFAFASKGWMMFAFMVPYALAGIAGPSLQSLISGNIPANEQGSNT